MKNQGCLFVDSVVGREVFEYVDFYGVRWMAFSKWGSRVKCPNQPYINIDSINETEK